MAAEAGARAVSGARARNRNWWRRRSVRARITALATAAVAAFLILAGVIGVHLVTFVLYRGAEDGARAHAGEIAALVRAGRLPTPIPASAGTAAVQVVDATGRVVASSADGDRLTSLVASGRLPTLRAGQALTLPASRLGESQPVRIVGVAADTVTGVATVVVAVPVEQVDQTTHVLAGTAAVGSLVATAVFAAACWFVTGSALRPVSVLRRSAARITAAGDDSRLPLPAADDEIRALAVTLNGMLVRLSASSARQRAFVADAAHELRSPLASLRVHLEVEARHPDPAGRDELLVDLLDEVGRLERLTSDLLDLARLEEPPTGETPSTDLDSVLREVVRETPRTAGVDLVVRPVRFRDVAGPLSAPVAADHRGVHTVVRNLVDNAVRHARARVEIGDRWTGPAGHRHPGRLRRRAGNRARRPGTGLRPLHPAGHRTDPLDRRLGPRPGHRRARAGGAGRLGRAVRRRPHQGRGGRPAGGGDLAGSRSRARSAGELAALSFDRSHLPGSRPPGVPSGRPAAGRHVRAAEHPRDGADPRQARGGAVPKIATGWRRPTRSPRPRATARMPRVRQEEVSTCPRPPDGASCSAAASVRRPSAPPSRSTRRRRPRPRRPAPPNSRPAPPSVGQSWPTSTTSTPVTSLSWSVTDPSSCTTPRSSPLSHTPPRDPESTPTRHHR